MSSTQSKPLTAAVTAPVASLLQVRIRPDADADLGFITNAWMRSFKNEYADVPNDIYYGGMTARLSRISNNPSSRVLVACDPVNPGKIYGFICYEAPSDTGGTLCVHYLYVKHDYRRRGVADALFVAAGGKREQTTVCTHRTFRYEQLQTKALLTLVSGRF